MTSTVEIDLYRRYRARVVIRRGPKWRVRPGADALDGREMVFLAAWRITPEDRNEYAGEFAMTSPELEPFDITWIASGDLMVLAEVP